MRANLIIPITLLILIMLSGCTRELRSKDETPWQPFEFDRIPVGEQSSAPADEISEQDTIDEPPELLADDEAEIIENPEISGLLDEGRSALNASEWTTAIEHFTRVLELDSVNTPALYNLGYAYRQMGNWDRAIEFARRAVESDPKRLLVHQNLGFAYLGKGEKDKAIDEFEAELINHPDEKRLAGLSEHLAQLYPVSYTHLTLPTKRIV